MPAADLIRDGHQVKDGQRKAHAECQHGEAPVHRAQSPQPQLLEQGQKRFQIKAREHFFSARFGKIKNVSFCTMCLVYFGDYWVHADINHLKARKIGRQGRVGAPLERMSFQPLPRTTGRQSFGEFIVKTR